MPVDPASLSIPIRLFRSVLSGVRHAPALAGHNITANGILRQLKGAQQHRFSVRNSGLSRLVRL